MSKKTFHTKPFLKQVKHDMFNGIIYSWKKYIPVVLIFIFACAFFQNDVSGYVQQGAIRASSPSFFDYIIELFKGMEKYNPSQKENTFEVPVVWLMIHTYLMYLISYYPVSDLHGYGHQILLRSKSRKQWWFSKCIWNITNVIVFYVIGYVVIFLFCVVKGNVSFEMHHEINLTVSKVNTANFTEINLILIACLLPILTSMAISLLEMVIVFLSSPIISCVVILSILVASAYSVSPLLLGNYLMILRSEAILPDEGVTIYLGIIINILLIICSIFIGHVKFRKLDILGKE